MPARRTRRAAARTAATATVIAAAAAVLVGFTAPVSGEAGPATFGLVASADGLRLAATVPGAPGADQLVDVGGLRAQAALDGLGTSTATAGVLHPGEVAAGVPAFLRSQGGVPAPDIPLIAVASHPTTPDAEAGAGPFTARAHSTAGLSAAEANAAGPDDPPRGVSTATVRRNDDASLAAEATSLIEGFRAGPLSISRIVVRAAAFRATDGALERRSSFEVTGAEIAGTALGLNEEGLVLPGSGVALPDTSPLRAALAEQGLTVTYLAGSETPDGVVSPAVQVSIRAGTSLSGTGASAVTWTLGRAVAAATSTAPAAPVGTPEVRFPEPGVVAPSAPPATAPATPPGPAGPPDTSGTLTVAGTAGAYGGPAPPAGPAADAPSGAVDDGLRAGVPALAGMSAGSPDRWSSLFYIVFVVAAGGVLAAGHLLRALGVHGLWSS